MGARCCGSREMGGIYMVTELSPFGKPLEWFMNCPALPIPAGLGITPIGQTLVDSDGGQMIFDWIGVSNYPNCADFWEEVRYMGASRRISADIALRLRPGAYLYPVHAKAIIQNWLEYPGRHLDECPKAPQKHEIDWHNDATDREMAWFAKEYPDSALKYETRGCTGYWLEDLVGGEPCADEGDDERLVRRVLPCGAYRGLASPTNVEPDYLPGIMGRLPITRLHVINGAEESEERYEMLKRNAREHGGYAPRMMNE